VETKSACRNNAEGIHQSESRTSPGVGRQMDTQSAKRTLGTTRQGGW